MKRLFVLLALVGCAHAEPVPAEINADDPVRTIVAGELLVVTNDPSALDTSVLAAALGRDDFSVRSTECLTARICRVVVERLGEPADELWTHQLIQALSDAPPAGIVSIEPNAVAHPIEQQGAQP